MLIIVELIRRSILAILLGEAIHRDARVLQVETYHAHAILIHATPSITYYQRVTLGNYDGRHFSVVSHLNIQYVPILMLFIYVILLSSFRLYRISFILMFI